MLHELDDALRALIMRDVGAAAEVDVAFDAPNSDWAARRSGPMINAFMYDIREETKERDVTPRDIRDADGRVVARRPPPRRFNVSYLLTAWTQRPEDEHRLLAGLLSGLLAHSVIPADLLSGSLGDLQMMVSIELAQPPAADRSLTDIWSALGGELKPSIDLRLNAPIDPGRSYPFGPPVLESPRVSVGDIDAESSADDYRQARQGSPLGASPKDGDRPGHEVLEAGAPDRPGRTLSIRVTDRAMVDLTGQEGESDGP